MVYLSGVLAGFYRLHKSELCLKWGSKHKLRIEGFVGAFVVEGFWFGVQDFGFHASGPSRKHFSKQECTRNVVN